MLLAATMTMVEQEEDFPSTLGLAEMPLAQAPADKRDKSLLLSELEEPLLPEPPVSEVD